MKTGILILNYNNATDTINCIHSIQQFNTAEIKIIIVDNASTNNEVVNELFNFIREEYLTESIIVNEGDMISHTLPLITLFLSKDNGGYAQGNNKGLELFYKDDEIDNVLILNNDVLFVEDIIPKLDLRLNELNDIAILSPLLYKKDLVAIDYNCARTNVGILDLILTYFLLSVRINPYTSSKHLILIEHPELLQNELVEIQLPSGSCMMFKKRLFQKIGGFDPHTFLYYEENILHRKIEKMGLKNFLCTDIKCIHLGASTTSKISYNYTYYNRTNNSALYYAKEYLHANVMEFLFLKAMMKLYLCRKHIEHIIKSFFYY